MVISGWTVDRRWWSVEMEENKGEEIDLPAQRGQPAAPERNSPWSLRHFYRERSPLLIPTVLFPL